MFSFSFDKNFKNLEFYKVYRKKLHICTNKIYNKRVESQERMESSEIRDIIFFLCILETNFSSLEFSASKNFRNLINYFIQR